MCQSPDSYGILASWMVGRFKGKVGRFSLKFTLFVANLKSCNNHALCREFINRNVSESIWCPFTVTDVIIFLLLKKKFLNDFLIPTLIEINPRNWLSSYKKQFNFLSHLLESLTLKQRLSPLIKETSYFIFLALVKESFPTLS